MMQFKNDRQREKEGTCFVLNVKTSRGKKLIGPA